MCGIAGIVNTRLETKEKAINGMVAAIVTRGPDDDGFFVDDQVGLGMRRLSIIDLESGKQPIYSKDGKSLIFYNGELYNYQELRERLVKKGFEFKTHTDTEVILHMYEAYGPKMLPELRGMFTFCIYNVETKKVFIARDFFGIKPLYLLRENGKIVAFSSEIKSFFSYPGFKPEVNDAAVVNYLAFQYNPLEETFFKGVFKLPPAHYLEIDLEKGTTHQEKYWSFEFAERADRDEEKMAQEVYDTMKDSVRHHMIADVPVGSFLSGGIDSSIIATLMQEIRGEKKIKTFTVGWDHLTEGVEAKQTSDFLGTDHTEIKIGRDEYFKHLPTAVWHFDEPVADASAIGLYFLSREARKQVTVVLSGEGADELFGGYNIYLEPFARKYLTWIPEKILKLFLKIPFTFRGKNYIERASKKIEDWYIGNASIFKVPEIAQLWKGVVPLSFDMKTIYRQIPHADDSAKMQYIDIHTWLVGDILAKADKMTMAHSLELRVPFLDKKVADLARTLPKEFKWRNGVTKYLLRKAFKNIIPEKTRMRKKLGFPTPIGKWLATDPVIEYGGTTRKVSEIILGNPYIQKNMNREVVEKIIHDHLSQKADTSRKTYILLMLALWYEVFVTDYLTKYK